MRLFGYYALHSFVNQLKKIFKTWVMIFLLVCVLIGVFIGLFAVAIEKMTQEPEAVQEEMAEGGALEEEISEDDPQEPSFSERMGIRQYDLLELIVGGVLVILFVFEIMMADKSGGKIFLPADVTLLFPSPMKPQSVLLFRLMTQMGVAIFGSVYMLFQLPNLVVNMGLGIWGALSLIAVWGLSIIFMTLVQVFLYTLTSSHSGTKKYIRPIVYAGLALVAGGFLLTRDPEQNVLAALCGYFNGTLSRCIPVWGWLKGFCMYAIEGNGLGTALCACALAAGGAGLVALIWHLNADFYEDAMAESEETAALLEKARSENGAMVVKRKKDRGDGLLRDGIKHGKGADIFFFKTLYNRKRFSHLGFLTKTMETYLVVAVGVAILCRQLFDTASTLPVVLTLGALVFFRTLGNPLEQDTSMPYFVTIPESAWKKLFWSLMGGSMCCLLDLFLPMILGAVILGANPLRILLWLPLLLSVDFYGTNVGVFINLSVPGSAGVMIKQMVQIMFIYFGLLPGILILVLGIATGHVIAAALGATVFHFLLGFLFFALSPLFLEP